MLLGGGTQLLVVEGTLTDPDVSANMALKEEPIHISNRDSSTEAAIIDGTVATCVSSGMLVGIAAHAALVTTCGNTGDYDRDHNDIAPVPEVRASVVGPGKFCGFDEDGSRQVGWPPSSAHSHTMSVPNAHNRLYTPPVVLGGMGLSMTGLSLSHASPPHALIASRKARGAGPLGVCLSNTLDLPSLGSGAMADDEVGGGEGVSCGNVATRDEAVRATIDSEKQGSSDDLDLMYDPMLNCYYDPKTNKYYELA